MNSKKTPDFSNIASVLEKQVPKRPTLFEFFLNENLYNELVSDIPQKHRLTHFQKYVFAYEKAGYDYATLKSSEFIFPHTISEAKNTISINDSTISTKDDFEHYVKNFVRPSQCSLNEFKEIPEFLPNGMKVIIWSPGGVLENVISLLGYENLCTMIYDDEQLVFDIFEFVGNALLEYYKIYLDFNFVGAAIVNDDWGFNTQTMLSPEDMRRFVFPWHRKITQEIHSKGKYAILHSCGNYSSIIDDIIYDMKYDARHSYEDKIIPVEQAYDQLKSKLAILGGIDLNFLITQSKEEIIKRCEHMLNLSQKYGGYALGSGNSIPDYVPNENYYAMISVANK